MKPEIFEHFELALLHQSDFLLLCFHSGDLAAENVVLLLDGVQLSVKIFFLLLVAALLLGQLGAALLDLPLVFRAAFVYFFLCLKESFLFLLSALFIDSLIMRLASSSALDISRSATFLR